MRYIRYAFLACLAVALITVALANREMVVLRLLSDELGEVLGIGGTVELPLFLVIFGGIVAGVAIGFVWEWLREMKYRGAVTSERREKEKLRREVDRLRAKDEAPKDDVLALLEDAR